MSKAMQKCYNVMVTGKVQDIGFRTLIEDIARLLDLKGFVFNDVDGSVKMVCCGENGVISNLFKEIRIRGEQMGVVIEDITKEEIPFHIYLPDKFLRLYTDELADI
ncbi:MAG: acylphosphatase, partial [Candidatus Methanoperedens sp.]|nr:acylphosphatase [Candidatus Methanoperedens sp.]